MRRLGARRRAARRPVVRARCARFGWCGSGETAADRQGVLTAGRSTRSSPCPPTPRHVRDDANHRGRRRCVDLSWWVGQDWTRVPNFDQAVFNGTPLSRHLARATAGSDFVLRRHGRECRLVERSRRSCSTRASRSVLSTSSTSRARPRTRTSVGPAGGQLDVGPSFAVVYTAGCSGVPTDTIAAHELLHALGAVPPGDPHCPARPGSSLRLADGHPLPLHERCADLAEGPRLQPRRLLRALAELAGRAGLALAASARRAAGRVDHVVRRASERVTSDVPGVDCSATCCTQWDPGTVVSLDAEPAATDRFVRWTGACTGAGTCQLTLAQATSVTAVYGPLRIPVRLSIAGKGKVELLTRLHEDVRRRWLPFPEGGPCERLEVRRLERRLQGRARDLLRRRPITR